MKKSAKAEKKTDVLAKAGASKISEATPTPKNQSFGKKRK